MTIYLFCCIAASCPSEVGFPTVELPHHQSGSTHALIQLIFPCEGIMKGLTFYSASGKATFTIAIARWSDGPLDKAEIVHVIKQTATQTGVNNISGLNGGNGYSVKAGDFVVLVGDVSDASCIAYMTHMDDISGGSYPQLALRTESLLELEEGDILDLDNEETWMKERKVFAIKFDITETDTSLMTGVYFSNLYVNLSCLESVWSWGDGTRGYP